MLFCIILLNKWSNVLLCMLFVIFNVFCNVNVLLLNVIVWSIIFNVLCIFFLDVLVINVKVLFLYLICCVFVINFKCLIIWSRLIVLKLKCCVLEMIVGGILCGFVVVNIKIVCVGGFFNVFKRVLKVFVVSMCILFII